MYNGKYVSTDFLIDKIQQNYGFTNLTDRLEIADDIFDAIELIGVPLVLIDKITNGEGDNPPVVVIEDYCAPLPCDLRQIMGVRTHDTKTPLIEETGTFKSSDSSEGTEHTAYDYPVYHVNDSNIFTNFETGELEISYKAFPCDEAGIPLIPDNTRYINGVMAYVAERIGFRLWWKDMISDKKYKHLESERLWYIPSAGSSIKTPSYDQAESLKNQLSRMIRSSNHHLYNFKYLNNQEFLKNHK